AHLAEHGRLVALRAAGVDGDVEAAAGGLLPLLSHLLEVLVPDRILRDERRELDARLRGRRGDEQEEQKWGDPFRVAEPPPYCFARFAVHSICPMPVTSALPLTMESPSRSPLISTVISPCGVLATNVSLIALPSIVPVTGASPI